jgi:two-component system, OmpR family, sensor histidine kinase TctE
MRRATDEDLGLASAENPPPEHRLARLFRPLRSPEGWQRSLFGEILDWMLAPLLLLWPISMVLEYHVAVSLAGSAYDRELGARLSVLTQQVTYRNDKISLDLAPAAEALLRGTDGLTLFSVRGRDNELIAGDARLPIAEFTPELEPGRIYFRSDLPTDLRAAYVFAQLPGYPSAVLLQVAETEEKRTRLASEVMGRVLATQFILVPIAVMLVWFGLSQGVRPLSEVQARIRRRRPHDLSPIDARDAPEELHPFLASINDLMARLDASIRAQRRFVADAAHQMRTPLAGLRTQAELALTEERRSEVDHAIRQIALSADRASHMVNQLLALARAESDTPVALKRHDLRDLAREVTGDWVPRALEKSIDLGFECDAAERWIDANEFLVRELISNLIDNAIRYSPNNGRVTVRVERVMGSNSGSSSSDSSRSRLIVEDTGIGVAESERALVFERFYRAANAQEFSSPHGGGASGLGLAIVREIAAQHGATVTLGVRADHPTHDPAFPGTVVTVEFSSIDDSATHG